MDPHSLISHFLSTGSSQRAIELWLEVGSLLEETSAKKENKKPTPPRAHITSLEPRSFQHIASYLRARDIFKLRLSGSVADSSLLGVAVDFTLASDEGTPEKSGTAR